MSNFQPQPPKRLVRSTSSRVVGGVCGGVADYLNLDANLVRILTALITLFTGVPIILYLVALFVMPEDTAGPSAPPPVYGAPTYSDPFAAPQATNQPPAYAPYPGAAGTGQRPGAEDTVWGSEGAPWEQRQPEPVAPTEPEAPVVPPVSRPAGDPPVS